MKARERLGLSVGPLFLRLALGIIFTWAGLAKLIGTMPYSPDQLAQLANMGADIPPAVPTPAVNPTPATGAASANSPTAPSTSTTPRPPTQPMPEPVQGGGHARVNMNLEVRGASPVLGAMARQPAPSSSSGTTGAPVTTPPAAAPTGRVYAMADFPESRELKPLYQVALILKARSQSPPDQPNIAPLVPSALGRGSTPLYLAWAAAITEFLCGAMLIVGLFTRMAGLALSCVMIMAAWLTQIGPAAAVGGKLLGFLPGDASTWSETNLYTVLWLQFALFMMAMALVFLGPGALSLDGAFSSSPSPKGGTGKPPAGK